MPARKLILVVDDDPDIRELLLQVLLDEGYRAAGASNGREALDYLRRSDLPSLILLDLMMPVMNGWQFRDEQRLDPRLGAIPVVVISANSNVRRDAATLLADDYMNKPLDLQRLFAAIERHGVPSAVKPPIAG